MEQNYAPRQQDASSTDAAACPFASNDHNDAQPPAPKRIGWIEACPEPSRRGHMPPIVDPMVPAHPENSFTETRRLRHDGWTPQKKRLFLERFAECGVIVEACEAAGMSARAAYNLRDRDPLFAAGWEAASVKARAPLADEAYSRSRNGVVERIYKDGVIVAERHKYDNRLTMAVLHRLDARIDRAEERGDSHLNLVARWDDYLDAMGEDRVEEGMALLAPSAPEPPAPSTPPADLPAIAGHRELHELHPGGRGEMDDDRHRVWEAEGRWWTDYPPPAGFEGEGRGEYGDPDYRRTLSSAEQAVVDAEGAEDAADPAEARARAEAQRDDYFGLTPGRPPCGPSLGS
jgi:hypothetical protein